MIRPTIHWFAKVPRTIKQHTQRGIASIAPRSDEQLSRYLRPGPWFWAALLIGVVIRLHFVLFAEGTYDVNIWQAHATGVQQEGLIGYYHTSEEMNHPPFISIAISWLSTAAQATRIPFRILLRTPFALLDTSTALLLLCAFRNNRYRFVAAACYWLHPLTMIFSAYHGNTDSSIAFFLMLCLYLLSKDKVIWAGAVLGISLWIKLPGMLALPAFILFLPRWRTRFMFILVVGIVGISTYLPALVADPEILCNNVFKYRGQTIQTTGGLPVWGTRIIFYLKQLPLQWRRQWYEPFLFYFKYNTYFCLVPILLLSWLRRSERTIRELGRTIAAIYTIVYGFSNFWSFQYFAWSIPFWFFAGPCFLVLATLLAGGYIYGLYWLLCGNGYLLGPWDFIGHPDWPPFLKLLRNVAVLFFFASAWVFLINGIRREVTRAYRNL